MTQKPKKQKLEDFTPWPKKMEKICRRAETLIDLHWREELDEDEALFYLATFGIGNASPRGGRTKRCIIEGPALILYFLFTNRFRLAQKMTYYGWNHEVIVTLPLFSGRDQAAKVMNDKYEGDYSLTQYAWEFYLEKAFFLDKYDWFNERTEKKFDKYRSNAQRRVSSRKWDAKLYEGFGWNDSYLFSSFVKSGFEGSLDLWKPYFDWYDWHQEQDPQPDYKRVLIGAGGNKHWKPTVGFMRHWYAALQDKPNKEMHARKAMDYCHEWVMHDGFYPECHFTTSNIPYLLILSYAMRLELEVDLERALEFGKYFKYLFYCFPGAWKTLEKYGVEQVVEDVIPESKLCKLREGYKEEREAKEKAWKQEMQDARWSIHS